MRRPNHQNPETHTCCYTRNTGSNVHPTVWDQQSETGPCYYKNKHTLPYTHTHTNSNYHTS